MSTFNVNNEAEASERYWNKKTGTCAVLVVLGSIIGFCLIVFAIGTHPEAYKTIADTVTETVTDTLDTLAN